MANNPYVNKVQKADGTVIMDISDTTAVASDVAQGKYFYNAAGAKVAGTASGGGDGDYIRTVVCPLQTFSNAAWTNYAMLANTPRLVDGDDYIITYDGTEYFCTCEELWGSDRFLGSTSLTWGGQSTDVIFPFCVEDWNNLSGPAVHAMDSGSHSIKIEHLELLTTGTTLVPKTVTANGTYDPEDDDADGYSSVVVNVPTGGGGASNVVTGTFKGTTTGAAMDVTLNYSGSGYPVAVVIYPTGGAYNSSAPSGSNAYNWYNLVKRYSVAVFTAVKTATDQVPFQGIVNKATTATVYKNSSSDATSYQRASSMEANTFGGNSMDAQSSNSVCVVFKSATTMSVFIASTSYGFAANIEYTYHVIYSS